MAAADAMQYKGTVTSATLPDLFVASTTDNNKYQGNVGDTYKYVGKPFSYGKETYYQGDLLIAEGEDGAVTYSVVPSGDTYLLNGDVTTTGFAIEDQNGGETFVGVTLAGSNGNDNRAAITVSGTVTTSTGHGGEATYTFAHGNAGATATTFTPGAATTATTQSAADENSSATVLSIPVITGLSIDGAGHVTGATSATYVVTDTHNRIDHVDVETTIASASQANIAVEVGNKDTDSATGTLYMVTSSGSAIQFSSGSVDTKPALSIDFVWGTF